MDELNGTRGGANFRGDENRVRERSFSDGARGRRAISTRRDELDVAIVSGTRRVEEREREGGGGKEGERGSRFTIRAFFLRDPSVWKPAPRASLSPPPLSLSLSHSLVRAVSSLDKRRCRRVDARRESACDG